MLSAYVLIRPRSARWRTSPRRSATWMVCSGPRISPAPNDVIASVQAPGLDQLGRLVVFRIQVVDGVTRTLTCTVINR
jgi:hypothetical protein